jgi:DNA-binding CsgD family transcriptional regulator
MEKPLTKRENEALNLISSGFTYKEAAGKMKIMVRMVNFRLGYARKKLKEKNNAQAVRGRGTLDFPLRGEGQGERGQRPSRQLSLQETS